MFYCYYGVENINVPVCKNFVLWQALPEMKEEKLVAASRHLCCKQLYDQ